MARRGRFTNPNSGGQNLTALIASLLRERNANEEQALLNAYRTGTAYNGSVPTADDIQAFYDQWASNAGYTPGTLEYQAIFQKKADLNNYDVKKQFNELISTFNTTDGANYQDIINFLGNEAQTSTDPNDLADYANAIETTTNAYLKYQGQRLVRGELTAAEYQRITLESIKVLDPDSTAYKNAIYDAFQYEWNAEATKWQNRIKAGTATNAQFRSWANGFKNRLVQSNISKDSDLYTSIGASIAQASIAVGDSPINARLNTTLADLNDVFGLAQAQIGGVDIGIGDIMSDPKDVLKKLRDNPELMGLYAEWIDDNPNALGPTLARLKITDGASFRRWFDDALKSGITDAQTITAAGGSANWDDWVGAATTNGSLTTFDEYAVVSSKHLRDTSNARGDDQLIAFYDNEYRKFLSGEKSYYGKAPAFQMYEQQATVIQNELNAMNGQHTQGALTLSGALSGEELPWENINTTVENNLALSTGQAVRVWNKDTGVFTTEPPRAKGLNYKNGSYQYVGYTVLPDGTTIASVISITGKKIVDGSGNANGFVYELPNGRTYATDIQGTVYEVTSAVPVASEGYSVDDFSTIGVKRDKIPLIDLSGLKDNRSLSSINPVVIQDGVIATDLRTAAELAAGLVGALDQESASALESEIGTLTTRANNLDATYLYATPTTENFIKAAELLGNPLAATIKANPDLYKEVQPGVFVKKSTIGTGDFFLDIGLRLAEAGTPYGNNANYPERIDLRSPEAIAAESRPGQTAMAQELATNLNPVADGNNLLSSFFGNLIFKDKTPKYSNTFAPILPASATTSSVVVPPTTPVYKPDIIGPTAPAAPVAPPPPPPVLPPSRGGGRVAL